MWSNSFEKLELELADCPDASSHFFCQILSGDTNNRCRLEAIAHACIVRGQLRVKKDRTANTAFISLPYECSLDSGQHFTVKEVSPINYIEHVPHYVTAQKVYILRGSQFPVDIPVESMCLEVVLASYSQLDEDFGDKSSHKDILLFRAQVQYKTYDAVKLTGTYMTYHIVEVVLEDMVLLSLDVSLPRVSSLRMATNVSHNMATDRIKTIPELCIRWLQWNKLELLVLGSILSLWLLLRSDPQQVVLRRLPGWITSAYSFPFLAMVVVFLLRYPLQRLKAMLFPPSVEWNGRSFFVNGWNAWSFCGSVQHGQRPPMYSMPNMFVQAFHHGGQGTALPINLGYGSIPTLNKKTAGKDIASSNPVPRLNAKGKRGKRSPAPISELKPLTATAASAAEILTMSADDAKDVSVSPDSDDDLELGVHSQLSRKTLTADFIASDMFTVLADVRSQFGIVIGFLSQKQHFGCIASNESYDRLTVRLSGDNVLMLSGQKFHTDHVVLYAKHGLDHVFDTYMNMSSLENQVSKRLQSGVGLKVPTGWCSWYHFYDKISEDVLRKNIAQMQTFQQHYAIPSKDLFPLFQVDDGYQQAWGDWTTLKPAFNSSKTLYPLVETLRSQQLTAGLWIAPFACDKHSQVAKQHPEWILCKDRQHASPCNSANCGKFFYGLDVTNPQCQQYIAEYLQVMTKVWQFQYLKMDFLYAAVLQDAQESYFDRTLTRAQILQRGMQLVADNVNPTDGEDKVFILGCGAPLGSVIGHVHANRISADAGLTWTPSFPLPSSDKWNLPCARNMLRNTLTRLYMHQKWWINDPDCMLLRDPLVFTNDEVQGLATVKAMSGGSMIISDHFDNVSQGRMSILLKLLPPSNKAAVAIDLLEREVPELLRLQLTSNYFRAEGKNALAALSPRKSTSQDEVDGPVKLSATRMRGKMGRSSSSDAYWKDHVSLEVSSEDEEEDVESVHSFDAERLLLEQQQLTQDEEDEEEEVHLLDSDDDLDAMNTSALLDPQQEEDDLLDVTLDPVLMKSKSIDQVVGASPSMPLLSNVGRAPSRQSSGRKLTSAASFSQKSMQQLIHESQSNTNTPTTPSNHISSSKKKLQQSQAHSQSSLALRLLGGMGSKVEQQFSEDSDSSPYFPYARKTLAKQKQQQKQASADNASDGNSEEFSPLLSAHHKEAPVISNNHSHTVPLDSVKVFDVTKRSFSPDPISSDPTVRGEDGEVEESYGYGRRISKDLPPPPPGQVIVGSLDLPLNSPTASLGHKTVLVADMEYSTPELVTKKSMLDSIGRSNGMTGQSFRFQQYKQGAQVKQRFPSKDDLHKRWMLFTVGNWEAVDPHFAARQQRSCIVDPKTKAKTYFVSLRDIFGQDFLQECQLYVQYLQQQSQVMLMASSQRWITPTRKSSLSAISQSFRHSPAHSLRGTALSSSAANNNPATPSTSNVEQLSHILHLFNFWTESYHHKVIQLHAEDGEEHGEVVFANVPFHSAHIYSLNLSLHPMFPKYLGSNLHFSCGLEVKRCHTVETREHVKVALTRKCFLTMPKKRSKSNIFSPAASLGIGSNVFATPNNNSQVNSDHPYLPIIKTMCIELEDFAIRDAKCKGAIWVFLPVSFHQTKQYNHILGKTEVHGDVFYNPTLPAHKPSGAEEAAYGGLSMVEYVEERSCRAAGYVFKLAVAAPATSEGTGFRGNTKIEISWVVDIEEQHP